MTDTDSPTPPAAVSPPVILQVMPELETGGVERGCVDIALFIKAAGGVPLVATAGGRLVHELERAGIKHITLPLQSKNPLVARKNVQRLLDIITEYKVDIVHARSRAPAWSAFFAAKKAGCAFVTTFHAAYNYNSKIKKFYNAIMARGDRVIAISGYIATHIHTAYGTAMEKIRPIVRGIDLFKFNPDHVTAERMASLAESWRLPDGQKVILCPGRLTRIKGQLVLLEALAKLERRDFICVLAGSDQGRTAYSEVLEARALELGLAGHVTMVGDCTDMPTAYMLADVVVAPSIVPEGFGRTAVEAQAMGRPIIASDLGGMSETVLEGETGWLVQPHSPAALATALQEALDLTEEQRFNIAARSVQHVRDNYSKDRMGWATLDVYAELINRPVPWAAAE